VQEIGTYFVIGVYNFTFNGSTISRGTGLGVGY